MSSGRERVKALLGGTSAAPFRVAQSVVRRGRDVAYDAEGRYRRVTGRRRQVVVGPHRMAVPDDMRWAFPGGAYYERHVTERLLQLLVDAPAPVFYDIGANCGYYTLLLAPRVAEVHAFEPVSTTHAVLAGNVARNEGLDHVHLHRVGLSDQPGTAEIHLYSSSGNNSLFDVDVDRSVVSAAGTETIALTTLDALGATPPGLIKMDVEGAELLVLRGARRTLAEHLPSVLLEFSEPHFRRAGYAGADVVAELTSHGYAVVGMDEDGAVVSDLEAGAERIGTLIAAQPSRLPPGLAAALR